MGKCLRLPLEKVQTTSGMNIGIMSHGSSDSMDFLGEKKGCDPGGVLKQACGKQTSYLYTKVGKPVLYFEEGNAESICCACDCLDGTEKDRNATVVNYFKGKSLALLSYERMKQKRTGMQL